LNEADSLQGKIEFEELANEGETSGVEKDNIPTFNEPFDPQTISISSKTIALDAVLRRIKNNTIRLAPDFQRNFVWNDTRKSLLIESMMLKIPLPMFYVAEDKDGIWEVVDGLQRLSTIKEFILGISSKKPGSDPFKLRNLEFWGDKFDGKTYSDIEESPTENRIINNIMESELSFTIINPDTPEKVKRNIFKRINTGGLPLTDQEIRHALYQGESTRLLAELVTTREYKVSTQESVKDDRMAGRELVLRLVSFLLLDQNDYKGDMDSFMSASMLYLNRDEGSNEYRVKGSYSTNIFLFESIKQSLSKCFEIFGKHCFRKSIFLESRSPINKSLFELWGVIFNELSDKDYKIILKNKSEFLNGYSKLLINESFLNSISRHSSSPSRGVKIRYKMANELIMNYLD